MPRRAALSAADRMALLGLPLTPEGLIQHYTLSDADLDVVRKHRGDHNRLGFAVQFCYLRHPGCALPPDGIPPSRLLDFLGPQIDVDPRVWERYAGRAQTRREHLVELQHYLDLTSFGHSQYRSILNHVALLAEETDRGLVLANRLVERLRAERIIVPPLEVIERLCAEALSQGERRVFEILTQRLSVLSRRRLDRLISRSRTRHSQLAWLREPPPAPKAKHVLVHLNRLDLIRDLQLPADLAQGTHPGRLLKLAREGGQMTAQHLRDLEDNRRYATLAALLLDIQRTIIDDLVHMHDRIVGDLFSLARHNHADQFQQSGKAINDKVRLYSRVGRALIKAKEDGRDPFSAIEEILPWEAFSESVAEAEKLAQPEAFDFLPLVGEGYGKLRRYTPALLDALALHAAPAARDVLAAVEVLRETNRRQARTIPQDAPTSFVRKRWVDLVHTPDGLDRRFYEICALAEVKNAIRSGDIWVEGSRQYRDFQEYLLPTARYRDLRDRQELGLAVETQCDRFLEARLALLERQLAAVEPLAQQGELPGVSITETGLKVSPLIKAVPDEAEELTRQAYGLLPRVRITDVLLEVDSWTDFSRHFTHLKSGESVRDRSLLLTVVLADAINLGLTKMADACPGVSYPKLSWLQAWHIRDETYTAALAELVNAQFRQPFAAWWGAGTTSSSDGRTSAQVGAATCGAW